VSTTYIRNCDWIIVWDGEKKRHRYARNLDLVFRDDKIIHVGPNYAGAFDTEISGLGLMAMPGLVDIHSHPALEPAYKGIREEHGIADMYMSGLYERCAVMHQDDECYRACAELTYCEMLLSGVTSVADLSVPYPGWKELAEKSGLRVWLAPGYASSRWYMDNGHEVKFAWDEAKGEQGFEAAMTFIDGLEPGGRISGIIYPLQIDTCTEDLLRKSIAAALERNIPLTTHASQSVMEFNLMVQRHGKTPIQWAHEIGLLTPNTILGHTIFIDEHSWLHWHTRKDVPLLAETGTVVAHCPNVFSRYGHLLEDFGRYTKAGVRMAIGTDTTPHNMIEEMRETAVFARIAAEDLFTTSTEEVFTAATVGGAAALMRDDIGRLAVGMKADIVLVDLKHPSMRPLRDPLRSLIYASAERAVRHVFIDGQQVVRDSKVLTLDMEDACVRAEEGQVRMMQRVPEFDYANRTIDEISPLSLEC